MPRASSSRTTTPRLRNFAALWEGHPAVCGEMYPCVSADGSPHFENQCAIRMGLALERAGISLADYPGARCWHGHNHVIRAQELADWMRQRKDLFGQVEVRRKARAEHFAGRRGIVFFRDFWGAGNRGDHIDVWDGTKMGCGDNSYFERSREVWFWPIP
ncbi:MAG: type VI secretion system amidase effector protein Tae4 [Myxococcales bacterium]|nr:type VI secretion system amidase effector protein Tae4 [Myxococcota bacterium]MDW8283656.1 type VI secretion system amidase effector protein Tae4 [Myxococcales bacterium]